MVLFVRLTAVLTMFAGLALEAFGGESAGKATPRFVGFAVPVTLLSGFYLGARFGVLANDWMRASYGGIVAMIAAGTLAHRSEALRRISLRARAAFGLAVVFLMTAKPGCGVPDDCEARPWCPWSCSAWHLAYRCSSRCRSDQVHSRAAYRQTRA